jgi:transcriptional regulator with PAS, ATPase and Fis domain
MPEPLLESELFGHMAGAFTDAKSHKPGLLETLDGGTILLDEVNSMPLGIQAKLLRFLQEHEICRVGSNVSRTVDVRVLAASNSRLHALVEQGRFREDLFYRLSVFTVEVPPLRERGDDLTLLATEFAKRAAARYHCDPPALADGDLARLRDHGWPGNVRELQSAIERLVVLGRLDLQPTRGDGGRRPGSLPECSRCGRRSGASEVAALQSGARSALGTLDGLVLDDGDVLPLHQATAAFQKAYLLRAIEQAGSLDNACRVLKISKATAYRRVKLRALAGFEARHAQ